MIRTLLFLFAVTTGTALAAADDWIVESNGYAQLLLNVNAYHDFLLGQGLLPFDLLQAIHLFGCAHNGAPRSRRACPGSPEMAPRRQAAGSL